MAHKTDADIFEAISVIERDLNRIRIDLTEKQGTKFEPNLSDKDKIYKELRKAGKIIANAQFLY